MATLTVSNRQRRLPINLDAVENTGVTLIHAVCQDLLANPAAHLKKSLIKRLDKSGELSLVLVSNAQIRKLNKQWMHKDRETDVLSFPLTLEPPPAELPWELGELVISVEKTAQQADSFGHSFERELAFLFVHGTLHILGFDHMDKAGEKDMFGRQKRILDAAGYPR